MKPRLAIILVFSLCMFAYLLLVGMLINQTAGTTNTQQISEMQSRSVAGRFVGMPTATITDEFLTTVFKIVTPIFVIVWIITLIAILLEAKSQGRNMPLWGAFAFFLAPIAGLTIVYFGTKKTQSTTVAETKR